MWWTLVETKHLQSSDWTVRKLFVYCRSVNLKTGRQRRGDKKRSVQLLKKRDRNSWRSMRPNYWVTCLEWVDRVSLGQSEVAQLWEFPESVGVLTASALLVWVHFALFALGSSLQKYSFWVRGFGLSCNVDALCSTRQKLPQHFGHPVLGIWDVSSKAGLF